MYLKNDFKLLYQQNTASASGFKHPLGAVKQITPEEILDTNNIVKILDESSAELTPEQIKSFKLIYEKQSTGGDGKISSNIYGSLSGIPNIETDTKLYFISNATDEVVIGDELPEPPIPPIEIAIYFRALDGRTGIDITQDFYFGAVGEVISSDFIENFLQTTKEQAVGKSFQSWSEDPQGYIITLEDEYKEFIAVFI